MQKRLTPPTAKRLFAQCRAPLLKWFEGSARALPWRQAATGPHDPGSSWGGPLPPRRAPYAVWVSEIMLQQTQVAAVVPYFQNWMSRFPTVEALAAAPEEEVLRAWAGLGYYSRARNLHRGARMLLALNPRPVTAREWEQVPGVGAYTAGAVSSLAFGRREGILDGNVIRVFSRLLALDFLPGSDASAKAVYWELARLWADAEKPGELNEALMELGALVCVPANPRCDQCPLAFGCRARKESRQTELPPAKPRARVEDVSAVAVRAIVENRVLVETRGPGGFLSGHELFPLFTGGQVESWRKEFQARNPGLRVVAAKPAGRFRHAIMAKRYAVAVWDVSLRRAAAYAPSRGARWIPADRVEGELTSALARKIWAAEAE